MQVKLISLIFTKKIDDEYHLVETVISAGKRNRLSTKTMWINKRKDLYSAVNAEAFPETSKTHEAKGLTKTLYPVLNRTESSPKLHVQNEPELGAKVNISQDDGKVNDGEGKFSIRKDDEGKDVVVIDKKNSGCFYEYENYKRYYITKKFGSQ